MDVVTIFAVRAVVTQRDRRLGEAVGVSGDLLGVAGALKEGVISEWDCKKRRIFQVERSTLASPLS